MFTEQEKQDFLSKVERENKRGTVYVPLIGTSADFSPKTLAIIDSLRKDGLILSCEEVINSTDHNACYQYCLNTELGIKAAKNWFYICQNPEKIEPNYWVQ